MATQPIPDLARRIEHIRFARSHHLPFEPVDVEELEQRLIRHAPFHPLALNIRAFDALPETALPPPPECLSGVASAFARGDFQDASSQAHALASQPLGPEEQARLYATIGDLECLVGTLEEAEVWFRKALVNLGPLPPIHVRLGRCALLRGDADNARSRAIRALVDNPIYGTALVLYLEACRALKIDLLPIPVQAGLVQTPNGLRAMSGLSPKALRAWTAWLESRAASTLEEVPPERTATLALIRTWRAGSDEDLGYTDTPSPDLDALDRMERAGILDAYLWFAGLEPRNASAWRDWVREHRATMERFWFEGLILP